MSHNVIKRDAKICIIPNLSGIGGPSSFHTMFTNRLGELGIPYTHDLSDPDISSLLVIGGSNQLFNIWKARQRGVRVVQRLNGMNWLHKKRKTGMRHYLRSEINNRVLAFIRSNLADAVIYQSNFASNWWQTVFKSTPAETRTIYNGVDLEIFTPVGEQKRPQDHIRIQLLEARLSGGYEVGLINAIQLVTAFNQQSDKQAELFVIGKVSDELCQYWNNHAGVNITWAGIMPRETIPMHNRSAHLLFSADLNAACPNSVLEAMASGLPVIAYATGALPELVGDEGGRVAPYGGNFWNLETPNPVRLVPEIQTILDNYQFFQGAARARAEKYFGSHQIVDQYLDVLLSD